MGNTVNLGLPYPANTDPVANAAAAIQALAAAIDVLTTLNPIRVRKTADEAVTSSTVMQDDDHLKFAVAAGKTYRYEFQLFMIAGSSAIDAKVALTSPSASAGLLYAVYGLDPALGAGNVGSATMIGSIGAAVPVGISSALTPVLIKGELVAAANGFCTLQWAQNVSTASAMTMKAGSFVRAEVL